MYAWEQKIRQTIKIDLIIPIDTNNCEDKLQNTLDYDAISQKITNYLENNSFALIETVAEKVAILMKESFSIKDLTITVSKPNAIKNADNIKITICR